MSVKSFLCPSLAEYTYYICNSGPTLSSSVYHDVHIWTVFEYNSSCFSYAPGKLLVLYNKYINNTTFPIGVTCHCIMKTPVWVTFKHQITPFLTVTRNVFLPILIKFLSLYPPYLEQPPQPPSFPTLAPSWRWWWWGWWCKEAGRWHWGPRRGGSLQAWSPAGSA